MKVFFNKVCHIATLEYVEFFCDILDMQLEYDEQIQYTMCKL